MDRSIFTSRQQNIGVCISLALSMMTTAAKAGDNQIPTQKMSTPTSHTLSTDTRKYNAPKEPSAPRTRTTTLGTRGGDTVDSNTSLTLLVPHQHVGRTRSQRPSFSWYVPDTGGFPIEFQLFKLRSGKTPQKILTLDLQSAPGFMQVSLPEEQPSLETGQRYRWKVIQFFDGPSRPFRAVASQAEIDVVSHPSNSVMTQLSQLLLPPLERAELAAKQGLWYDAISTVLHPKSPEALDLRTQLLREIGLEFEDTQPQQSQINQAKKSEETALPTPQN